jgi:hypothetical protein
VYDVLFLEDTDSFHSGGSTAPLTGSIILPTDLEDLAPGVGLFHDPQGQVGPVVLVDSFPVADKWVWAVDFYRESGGEKQYSGEGQNDGEAFHFAPPECVRQAQCSLVVKGTAGSKQQRNRRTMQMYYLSGMIPLLHIEDLLSTVFCAMVKILLLNRNQM